MPPPKLHISTAPKFGSALSGEEREHKFWDLDAQIAQIKHKIRQPELWSKVYSPHPFLSLSSFLVPKRFTNSFAHPYEAGGKACKCIPWNKRGQPDIIRRRGVCPHWTEITMWDGTDWRLVGKTFVDDWASERFVWTRELLLIKTQYYLVFLSHFLAFLWPNA